MEEKSKYAINYDEYIIFGEPTESDFIYDYERAAYAKEGIVVKVEARYNTIDNFEKYYDLILKDKYFYTKADIAKIFDFNIQFFQKYIKKDFSPIYVSRSVRDILKSCNYINWSKKVKLYDDTQEKIYRMGLELLDVIDFKTKIYYREKDVLDWIKNNVLKEELIFNEDSKENVKEIFNINLEEAREILKRGLKSNKSIKTLYDLQHDMQTTRLIHKKESLGLFKRYVIYNEGEKRPIIRYLIVNG